MKQAMLVFALVVAMVTLAETRRSVKFTGLDVEKIFNNERLMKSYIRCFLDQGPCTAQSREAKQLFHLVYETSCAQCNEDQKKNVRKFMKLFLSERMSDWEKFVQKYDPEIKKENEFLAWVNQS